MNTLKIQTEIMKHMHKGGKMGYQKSGDMFLVVVNHFGAAIPEREMLLNYEHDHAEFDCSLEDIFYNDSIRHVAASTNKLQELDNVMLRKLESGDGMVRCWVDEKLYKLFGDSFQYEITASDQPVLVISDKTQQVVGVILPFVCDSLEEHDGK